MAFEPPSPDQLRAIGDRLSLAITEEEAKLYAHYGADLAGALSRIEALAEWLPASAFARGTPQRPAPAENPHNAWAVKLLVRGRAGGKLAGKRIALKDTIALAGAPLCDGTRFLEGYVSEFDATVATRLLEAGGEIIGKAVCEFLSYSSGSHTSLSGPVENPRKRAHSAGGSSSGCAALVAAGEVDIAIGGDQAGSIRIPSAHCGVYGLKPTWGLVPYTGAASSEFNVDHLGPITANVRDNALALEVLAGSDGIDPRRSPGAAPAANYADGLARDVRGLRIGIVAEGFGHRSSMPEVDNAVRRAAALFQKLGAEIREISIPWHRDGVAVWLGFALEGYHANLMLGGGFGGNQGGLSWTGLQQRLASWRDHGAEIPANLRLGMLMGDYLRQRYRGFYYTRAMNLVRPLAAAYDEALGGCDLLVMPTVPRTARPLATGPLTPQEIIDQAFENIDNTSPFDLTHHPAMSIPCGLVDGCPVGMMLVARHHGEAMIYRAAHAFETAFDWRKLPEGAEREAQNQS